MREDHRDLRLHAERPTAREQQHRKFSSSPSNAQWIGRLKPNSRDAVVAVAGELLRDLPRAHAVDVSVQRPIKGIGGRRG